MKNFFVAVVFLLSLLSCSKEQISELVVYDVSLCKDLLQSSCATVVDTASYVKKIEIVFTEKKVIVDTLYDGIEIEHKGASLLVRSKVPAVEYRVSGASDNGSLTIISEFSPLVTFCGLSLIAEGRDVVQLSSKGLIVVRAEGDNRLSDKLLTAKGGKNDAVMNIMGRSMFVGQGNVTLCAARRNALLCTDTLFFNGTCLNVPSAPGNALTLNKTAYVSGGEMRLSSSKDVVKSKKGSFIVLGGNLCVSSVEDKADAVQVANFSMMGGTLSLDVKGAAADCIKAGRVCFSGGVVAATTAGDALFSDKKMDYSSASCIKADSCVYLSGAELTLCSNGVGAKGISCDGDVVVDGGSAYVVTRGAEAVHDVDLNAHASCKGIKCDGTFVMNGGDVDILVLGKGERNEGLEAKKDMAINGGSIYVYAYDDAINCGSRLVMNGGDVFCYSVANDAVDCNASFYMNGGFLVADGSYSPEQGVDVDDFSRFMVRGGVLVSVGGGMGSLSSMPLNSGTTVPAIVWSGANLKKGEFLNVEDSDKSVLSYSLTRDMSAGTVLVAGACLDRGESYILSLSSGVENGRYVGHGLYCENIVVGKAVEAKVSADELVSLVDAEGNVRHIAPGSKSGGFGFPSPPPGAAPEGGFEGGFPSPPPGFGPNVAFEGGFPPPPPAGEAGFDGAPWQKGGFPPFPQRIIEDVYSEKNLPNYDK